MAALCDNTVSRTSILHGSTKHDKWYSLEQVYREHIQEINEKLSELDDEIWGKIILMERNRRIAKAYLRSSSVSVDGSYDEFDGQRIGFNLFDNPYRDEETEEIRGKIAAGLTLRIDNQGNILAKRCGYSPVIVEGTEYPELHSLGADVLKVKGRLEVHQAVKVFDMRAFKNAVEYEFQQPYPDRKKLLFKSVLRISLVKKEPHPLKTPCWLFVINLVALEVLNRNGALSLSTSEFGTLDRSNGPSSDLLSCADYYNNSWSETSDKASVSSQQMSRMANSLALGLNLNPSCTTCSSPWSMMHRPFKELPPNARFLKRPCSEWDLRNSSCGRRSSLSSIHSLYSFDDKASATMAAMAASAVNKVGGEIDDEDDDKLCDSCTKSRQLYANARTNSELYDWGPPSKQDTRCRHAPPMCYDTASLCGSSCGPHTARPLSPTMSESFSESQTTDSGYNDSDVLACGQSFSAANIDKKCQHFGNQHRFIWPRCGMVCAATAVVEQGTDSEEMRTEAAAAAAMAMAMTPATAVDTHGLDSGDCTKPDHTRRAHASDVEIYRL